MNIINKTKKFFMENWKYILISLCFGLICTNIFYQVAENAKSHIASQVLRLHIIANSNEDYDQALKLKVRDKVLEYVSTITKNVENSKECESVVQNHIAEINKIATKEIAKNGYNYDAKSYVGNFSFPTKNYGDMSLPAGNYQALRVVIGEGSGENWWCVVYPNLCVSGATANTPSSSQKKLENVLSEEEYAIVTHNKSGNLPCKIKFKILELF